MQAPNSSWEPCDIEKQQTIIYQQSQRGAYWRRIGVPIIHSLRDKTPPLCDPWYIDPNSPEDWSPHFASLAPLAPTSRRVSWNARQPSAKGLWKACIFASKLGGARVEAEETPWEDGKRGRERDSRRGIQDGRQ